MKKITFVTLLIFFFKSYGQFGTQQIITEEAGGARGVFAADIDGDGDMDVISVSQGLNGKIAWYENLDGLGIYSTERVLDENIDSAKGVFCKDLDNDGDIDVLVAEGQLDLIMWYENLDGLGNFGQRQIISNTDGAISVYAVDIDNDGDADVLSASANENKIAWYKNDGLGNFGSQLVISNTVLSTRDVFAADLDGDGDMDVLTGAAATDEVLWFENTDGLGNFGVAQIITNNANGVLSIFAVDIDNDGDMDVLSASPSDNKVAWYENLDGLGNFGTQQIITTTIDEGERVVYAADLDNDGDVDVISAYQEDLDGAVIWYENLDGLGTFGEHQFVTTEVDGPRSIFAADIDNDGDMDVLSASLIDYKIAWYENLTPLKVDEFSLKNSVNIYPNPLQNNLNITTQNNLQITQIQVYDILGKLVAQNQNTQQLNVSHLASGVLFVKIYTNKGVLVKKVVKK